ncbi:Crp/Fnr family transcriptional regulator [Rhodobacter sp. CZR27]|uniref:Crp/Fnr family transcriptional regulator n=1 Tax=Rhodobacter sp. CZR27 TaxID=2033869 RepID=UPI000BBEFEC3|nr:Crp/Fnr family transcriptional regulator [Rhodobacter sp. CZR27]
MDRTVAERCILSVGWLADRPKTFQSVILQRARLVEIATGEEILTAGDEGGGIYGVISGGVGAYVPQEIEGEKLARILRTGAWFGYGPFIRGRPRSMSFRIMEPSVLMHLPLATLNQTAHASIENMRALSAMSEYGVDVALEIIADLKVASSHRRVATALLRAMPPEDNGGDGGPRRIFATQDQIGELSNLTRDVVNRELSRLTKSGAVGLGYRYVDIKDAATLRRIAFEGYPDKHGS